MGNILYPYKMSKNNFRNSELYTFYRKWPLLSNVILALAAIGLFVCLIFIFLNLWTHHGATSIVPDVRDMDYYEAVDILDDSDLEAVISDSIYDETKKPGQVVDVWPKPGAVVKAGREVYLTIVSFSPRQVVIDMPLTDISDRQAISYLQSHGIKSIQIVHVLSEYPDMVVAVRCEGKPVTLGSRIPANATVVLEVGALTLDNVSDTDITMPEDSDSITVSTGLETPKPIEEPEEEPDLGLD